MTDEAYTGRPEVIFGVWITKTGHKKLENFDGLTLTALRSIKWATKKVRLDRTGENPCIFKSKELSNSMRDGMHLDEINLRHIRSRNCKDDDNNSDEENDDDDNNNDDDNSKDDGDSDCDGDGFLLMFRSVSFKLDF